MVFAPGLVRGGNFGSSFRPYLVFGLSLQSVALWPLGDVFEQHVTHPPEKLIILDSVPCPPPKVAGNGSELLRSEERLLSCHDYSAPFPRAWELYLVNSRHMVPLPICRMQEKSSLPPWQFHVLIHPKQPQPLTCFNSSFHLTETPSTSDRRSHVHFLGQPLP